LPPWSPFSYTKGPEIGVLTLSVKMLCISNHLENNSFRETNFCATITKG